MHPLPPVTKVLLLVCVGLFCYLVLWPEQRYWLMLWPIQSGNWRPWQLVTYAFLHVDIFHLTINMIGLVLIGAPLEVQLGRKRYGLVIVAGGLSAAATAHLLSYLLGDPATYQGLSGALFGVLMAYVMLGPDRVVELIFPPMPIKIKYLVAIFVGIEILVGLSPTVSPAPFAHLGGMLGAWLLMRYWRSPRRR